MENANKMFLISTSGTVDACTIAILNITLLNFNKQFVKFFDKNPNQICPLGFRASGDLADIGFVQKDIQLSSLSSAPPRLLSSPSVDFS